VRPDASERRRGVARSADRAANTAWLLAALLAGCGGAPKKPQIIDDEPIVAGEPAESEASRPALQYYLVLTSDTQAMPDKAAVDAMFAAVDGQGARYAPVRAHVTWVPPGYQLDVELDFADLPHKAFSPERLAPLLADLPAPVRAQAEKARLAITLRSEINTLPGDNHIRLAGLAALYVADVSDGVVIDLLGRRAWTRDAWHAELVGRTLGPDQVRRVGRADGEGLWLHTRGLPRFGRPDVQMRGIKKENLPQAEALFTQVQASVQARGARPGDTVAGVTLQPCDAPKGFHDGACVQVPAP
jgi:hypothetical protein